jgi:hypothetical protein
MLLCELVLFLEKVIAANGPLSLRGRPFTSVVIIFVIFFLIFFAFFDILLPLFLLA